MSCPLSIIEYIRYHTIQTTASRCVTIDVCRVAIYLQCVAIDVPSLDLFITSPVPIKMLKAFNKGQKHSRLIQSPIFKMHIIFTIC